MMQNEAPVNFLSPEDAWIDRESTAGLAELRDADGESVMTFAATMPDEQIMRILEIANNFFNQGFVRGQRHKAAEILAALGVPASESQPVN